MNEVFLTVMGNVASRPKSALTKNGHSVTSFRLAQTPRRYERNRGGWTDGPTTFYTVTCWRGLADHVSSCLAVGDPVVVHGRLQAKEYVREDGTKAMTLELEATAAGHDLTRGTSMFMKAPPRSSTVGEERDTTAEDLAREVADEPVVAEGSTEPAEVTDAPGAAPGPRDRGRDSVPIPLVLGAWLSSSMSCPRRARRTATRSSSTT